jgi:anti-sigma regulatory factor (Ser/Thr protein kinase)
MAMHMTLQSQLLIHEETGLLRDLQNTEEDPSKLDILFRADHCAVRNRRYAENIALLAGVMPQRQWTTPVSTAEILMAAVSEIREYRRVQVALMAPGAIHGRVVADVIHIVAELLDNATASSGPEAAVTLEAVAVAAGLAIMIEDRGVGIKPATLDRLNAALQDPDSPAAAHDVGQGRVGLAVVARLAGRFGIGVQLAVSFTGGVRATVLIPTDLLGTSGTGAPHVVALPPTAAQLPAPTVVLGRAVPPSDVSAAGLPIRPVRGRDQVSHSVPDGGKPALARRTSSPDHRADQVVSVPQVPVQPPAPHASATPRPSGFGFIAGQNQARQARIGPVHPDSDSQESPL